LRISKPKRIRLNAADYQALLRRVFERDGYCCLRCGSPGALQGHHIKFRSQLGSDIDSNMASVCAVCHDILHGSKLEREKLAEKLRGRESGNASCGTMTPLPDLVGP
jgi:5-methylcytosine-specific restriction endonuclease McrA